MKHILKQIFYIPLAVALGMGVMSCNVHSSGYDSQEEEMNEKLKEAEENKKKEEQSKQVIKEKEASKQKIELDNENLQEEEHKVRHKMVTWMGPDPKKYEPEPNSFFHARPTCDRCGHSFNLNPEGCELAQSEFSLAAHIVKERDAETRGPWKYTKFKFTECHYCKTHDATRAMQAKVNTNVSTITNIENTITEEKSEMQRAEAAYIENSSRAAKIKNRIDRRKKEIEERLEAQARAAEAEEQAAEMKKRAVEMEEEAAKAKEEAAKAKKEKIDSVKEMLDNKLAINLIMKYSRCSREEIKEIGISMGIDIDTDYK
jgi:hypothetical protein